MNNERYKIVVHDTEPQYTNNCPIILQALAITKDGEKNKVLAQCKFKNLGDKQIAAIYISIKCCAIDDKHLEDLEHFAYMDLKARQYDEFGDRIPIYLPDHETRKIVITLKKVVYEDGTLWDNRENIPFTKLTFSVSPLSSLKLLDEQYRRELQKISPKWAKHNDLPAYTDIFVRCGCGEILVNEDNIVCPNCSTSMKKLNEIQDKEYLLNKLNSYNKQQEEKERQKEEHKKIIEAQRKEKKKRLKKIIVLVSIVIAIGIAATMGITKALFNDDYQKACQAFADGNYNSAKVWFSDINPTYKDVGAWQSLFEYMGENAYDIEDKTEVNNVGDLQRIDRQNWEQWWNSPYLDGYDYNLSVTNFAYVTAQHTYIANFAIEHPNDTKMLLENNAFQDLGKESLQRLADCKYSYAKYYYEYYVLTGDIYLNVDILLENMNIAQELYILAGSDENRQHQCEELIGKLQYYS